MTTKRRAALVATVALLAVLWITPRLLVPPSDDDRPTETGINVSISEVPPETVIYYIAEVGDQSPTWEHVGPNGPWPIRWSDQHSPVVYPGP